MRKFVARTVGIVAMLYGLSSWATPLVIDIEIIGPYTLPDSVNIDGVEWAQLDIFDEVSWSDIDAVCPQSAGGSCNGILQGILLTDWIWASVDNVNGLFNYFLSGAGVTGTDLLDGPDSYHGAHLSEWARAFYDAGFRVSPGVVSFSRFIVGPLRDLDADGAPRIALLADDQNFGSDLVRTDFPLYGGSRDDGYSGGWFFRPSEVPVASTLFLFFAGGFGLLLSRRSVIS